MSSVLRVGLLLFMFGLPSGNVKGEQRTPESPRLELTAGDRVLFLGNSFFERANDFGHIETALALRWPDRKIVFRNLGWDGDTVFGHARAGGRRRAVFGDAEEGFQRLVEHVHSLNPSVVFIAYGLNESFDDSAGLEDFRSGFQRLIDEFSSRSSPPRLVLLSPTAIDAGFGTNLDWRANIPEQTKSYVQRRNEMLVKYSGVIADVARSGGHEFVDLLRKNHATESSDIQTARDGGQTDKAPDKAPGTQRAATVNGIHPTGSQYRALAAAIANQLQLPDPIIGVASREAETLRAAIIKKNRLYFHRWRPRNDAFVYGERKDEQKIAQTEPENFEPYIAAQEQIIRNLLSNLGGAK